jgi:hypothetical protein
MSVDADGTFGFTVHLDYDGEYLVSLPQRNGDWIVATSYDAAQAVEQVESFIAQANLALARLKALSAPMPG